MVWFGKSGRCIEIPQLVEGDASSIGIRFAKSSPNGNPCTSPRLSFQSPDLKRFSLKLKQRNPVNAMQDDEKALTTMDTSIGGRTRRQFNKTGADIGYPISPFHYHFTPFGTSRTSKLSSLIIQRRQKLILRTLDHRSKSV